MGNAFSGVHITSVAHDNLIGTNGDGTADIAERNVISANAISGGTAGLKLSGYDNVVAGNYIGVDATGAAALGNLHYGLIMSGAASNGNLIGTDGDGIADAAEGNVISGNEWMGVVLTLGASNNQVSGNFIGTNAAGTAALPNVAINEGVGAVQIDTGASNNVIGTNGDGVGDAAERNVISGNSRRGIQIRGQGTNNNIVAGNYIGTNAAGNAALPNGQIGVEIIEEASGNLVGTDGDGLSDALEANVISGNLNVGVEIFMASNNQIAGNFIGTDKTGVSPIPNGLDGIQLQASNAGVTSGNTIGGSLAKRNVIAFNQGDGIDLSGSGVDPLVNPILFNSIFSNDGLGINLHPGNIAFNITPNDVGDGDSGANNLMNFPVLDSALSLNNAITISGDIIDGLANKSFQIQFFSSPACDPTGYGEGQTYLGQSTQMTNGSGDVSFLVNFMVVVSPGSFITATATNANNTSEFSACVEVLAGSQFNLETTAQPPLMIVPLQDLNCRYFCTAQSEVADTLLRGIQYSPVGWDPTLRYLAFEGPTFGELCFAPPTTGGSELMSLQVNNQLITLDQLTLDMVPLFSCPAYATPTPTVDVDEGENATETPVPPAIPQCSDGIDNDGDGIVDLRDPQCRNASDNDEAVP